MHAEKYNKMIAAGVPAIHAEYLQNKLDINTVDLLIKCLLAGTIKRNVEFGQSKTTLYTFIKDYNNKITIKQHKEN